MPFLPGILSLAHIHNTGAAFSMLSGARWFFVILTVAFVIFGMWVLLTGRLRHSLGKWSWVLVYLKTPGTKHPMAIEYDTGEKILQGVDLDSRQYCHPL